MGWQLGTMPGVSPAPFSSHPPSETICLSDSLDEDLATNSLESIAQALTLLNNSTNGLNANSTPSTSSSSSSPVVAKPHPHIVSPTLSSQSSMLKDVSSVQRQSVTPANKPSNVSTTTTTPAAKPRPPPTTTPLQKPFGAVGIKSGQVTPPTAQIKTPSNKISDSGAHQPSLNSLTPKSFQKMTTPPSPSLPLIHKKATPTGHYQQRFITPMQATITKSSQSSNSPIIKLTHRPSAQITPGLASCPPVQTTPSSQTVPPGSTHHPPAQTTPSCSTNRPPAQPMPPGSVHRPQVHSPAHQSAAHIVPPGSTHRSLVSTPSPPSTLHHSSITTSSSVHGNLPSASHPQNMGPAHRSPASTLPAACSTHRPLVSTPPSPSSHCPSVQTPPSSAYRPSVPTPPPSLAHRSPVATPPSVSSPAPSCPPVSTPPTQYNTKSSGFKPPFSPAPVATPHTSSFQDCKVTSSSVTTNHGQRQRSVGGAKQSNISSATCASAMGLPSLSDSALLNQVQKPIVCISLMYFSCLLWICSS